MALMRLSPMSSTWMEKGQGPPGSRAQAVDGNGQRAVGGDRREQLLT